MDSKRQILQSYLTSVYFGQGYYGLAAAAPGYFGLALARPVLGAGDLLAGLLQAPTAYDPLTHLDLAKQRQHDVLGRLVATGVLNRRQADAAFAAPLHLQAATRSPAPPAGEQPTTPLR